jgi:hypothetical protein
MRSGGNHPNASAPILSCIPCLSSPNYNFIIQVMGDFLAVLFHTPIGYLKGELFIWDWKSGRLLTVRFSSLSFFADSAHYIIVPKGFFSGQ